ncbi:hypothetical protein AAX16_03540 [Haemophilus haemolyticus]|nr:hypothetical protein AAX16_03540 [Haemophilus haemolyticus]
MGGFLLGVFMGLVSFNMMYEEQARFRQQQNQNDSTLDVAKLSTEQIKAKLTEFGVEFDPQTKKPELLALLQETLEQA